MRLNRLLAPVKCLDELVARRYAKITAELEKKGKDIGKIGICLNLTYLPACASSSILFLYNYPFLTMPLGIITGLDMSLSLVHEYDKRLNALGVKNYAGEHMKKITKIARLPEFVAGTYYMAHSLNTYYNALANNQHIDKAPFETILGISLILLASSIYLKDSDPKLLEKKPLWKSIYEKLRQKVGSYSPAHEPIPVTAERLSGLENYVS